MKDFTLGLALLDVCPVIFFGISMLIIASKFNSLLFFIGASLSFCAGLGKVLWKLLWALCKKDVRILSNQLKYTMSVGFICMIASLFIEKVNVVLILLSFWKLPSAIFFFTGIVGMCLMGYMGKTYSRTDDKANWIEEMINTIAQLCFLIGIILF
ncbi:MAG: hypothetical protein Q4C49_07860 [Bacillota bacterium]|nr:hypothetical protein [Bacillota bacterium]